MIEKVQIIKKCKGRNEVDWKIKNDCDGEWFLIMLVAFPIQQEALMESMGRRLVCNMDWAAFITFCNFVWSWAAQLPYQTVVHLDRCISRNREELLEI